MPRIHIPVLLLLGMLGACQSPAGGAVNETTPGTAARPAAQHVIRGKATYLQRIKMAPGAVFTVQLIDGRLADTPQAVLAQATLKDVAGPPYAFALPYDPTKLRADGMYGLHADLRGADGSLLFVTDTRIPYTPGQDDVGEFVMTMVHGAAAPAEAAPEGGKDNPVWDEARRRGVAFRAVGNEPGWWVEVTDADPPAIRAELDYGERRIEVAKAAGLGGSFGFGGKAADGTEVELRIRREPCSDDMSGAAFDARAELTVGGKTYRGCGNWLNDRR